MDIRTAIFSLNHSPFTAYDLAPLLHDCSLSYIQKALELLSQAGLIRKVDDGYKIVSKDPVTTWNEWMPMPVASQRSGVVVHAPQAYVALAHEIPSQPTLSFEDVEIEVLSTALMAMQNYAEAMKRVHAIIETMVGHGWQGNL